MKKVKMQIPEVFQGLFEPYRFKVFYGGRGGAKSRSFARALLLAALQRTERILCCREVQNSIRDSVKRLLDDEIERMGLRDYFVSTDAEIRCPKTNSLIIFTGLRISPDRIKSFEGLTKVWVEEAQSVSQRSLDLLLPTVREVGSEIWFSFNPEEITGAVYQMFVVRPAPPGSLVVKVGWEDNPWFPEVLRAEMEHCRETDPDKYDHVWGGNPVVVSRGSYYGKLMQAARDAGRLTHVPVDPYLLVHTAWDLGMGDSTAIWFFQVLDRGPVPEWRFIDYHECSGEGLPYYASVLTQRGYAYGEHIAPHDIAVRELGSGVSRLETAKKLGIRFKVAPNLPVDEGIDAVRGVLKNAWFDEAKCDQGLRCLWSYQHEWDEDNQVYKPKPKHDWTSHGSDAFRYACVGFKPRGSMVGTRGLQLEYA